jgi:pyruvate, orthophosphate dikinase
VTTEETLISCLRVKGFGKTEALAEALDLLAETIEAGLAELVAKGLAEPTRVGARLTANGRALALEALERERVGLDPHRVGVEYEKFTPLNADFKAMVTDWQMRQVDGKAVRNDHKDEAYDAAVLARLPPIDTATALVIDEIAAFAPRFASYKRRLANALAKTQAGDLRYLTAPDRDSYHTVWFELHQDLIGLLGTTREKEAAAGRAL